MYLKNPTATEIFNAIMDLHLSEDEVAIIMLGEENRPDILSLIELLNSAGINFFGGVFPGIIYGEANYSNGALVCSLPALAKPFLVKDLHTGVSQLPNLEAVIEGMDNKYTAVLFLDGLSPNITPFLTAVFDKLGNSVSYIGGGAGSLSLQQEPCVFTAEGVFQDAAVVALIKSQSCIGVRHGWECITGPVVATKTNGNIIVELNWKNAFTVYKKTVEADSGEIITAENFFDVSKKYPFGMLKEGEEYVVRDPIAVNEKGELVCVGEVPENSVLDILIGCKESLIKAAGEAMTDCYGIEHKEIRQALVIDCISRVLFLEERFKDELGAVRETLGQITDAHTLHGVLTLGEIASYGESYLGFLNKTIVVGVLYD